MTLEYDSRSESCKLPFGAVPEGERVFFRALGPLSLHSLTLVCYPDYAPWLRVPMERSLEGEQAAFTCSLTLDQPQVYWYFFEGEGEEGPVSFYRDPSRNRPVQAKEGATWQLTVYRRDFSTPSRYQGEIMYQIFPDRFARSGDAPNAIPADGFFQEDPSALPAFVLEEGQNQDYYGGDLKGIEEQLPYLDSLSVGLLYLNPIFEAHSNHRYNTADYHRVDPVLGEERDLARLIHKAGERGMGIVLDGVFSHTGSDSIYFNKEGRYPSIGAYQSQNSPYFSWYRFRHFPDDYACWWNVPTLPEVTEEDPEFLRFICGTPEEEETSGKKETSVLEHWQKLGLAGWRLDVADELPDGFLDRFSAALKRLSPQSLLIGEVWEDASNKISYGQRRRYLLGGQLDSVMNYPFREAILRYLKEGDSAFFSETVESVCENYPPQALHLLMNPLSTHDTPRAITLLAGEDSQGKDRLWQSRQRLSPEQWELGKKRLLLAMVIQYTLPGFPSVYYGDEQLMQGYGDPFNRCFFTRKDQDPGFLAAVQRLGRMRKSQSCYRSGNFRVLRCDENCLAFVRTAPGSRAVTVINRTPGEIFLSLFEGYDETIFSHGLTVENGRIRLLPYGCGVLLCPLPDSDKGGDHQGRQQPGV